MRPANRTPDLRSPRMTETTPEHLTVVRHPLVQHKLTHMRMHDTPTPVFRQLLREISQLLAYEVTREMPVVARRIDTPLCPMDAPVLDGPEPALISILRAGNGLLDGVLELIPQARVGFIGLYRDEATLQPVQYYFKVPDDLGSRMVFVVDPMLATGNSVSAALSRIKEHGATQIRFVCILAAPEGIKALTHSHPDVEIFTAAVDSHLNDHGYIIPGLGDAGDRMFGTK